MSMHKPGLNFLELAIKPLEHGACRRAAGALRLTDSVGNFSSMQSIFCAKIVATRVLDFPGSTPCMRSPWAQ
jgi:hypothetical protein